MPAGVDIKSPEQAYLTKGNIVYPSYKPTQAERQAQADAWVETEAQVQATAQGRVNGTQVAGVTAGSGTSASPGLEPGAIATSGSTTTVERQGLKAQT